MMAQIEKPTTLKCLPSQLLLPRTLIRHATGFAPFPSNGLSERIGSNAQSLSPVPYLLKIHIADYFPLRLCRRAAIQHRSFHSSRTIRNCSQDLDRDYQLVIGSYDGCVYVHLDHSRDFK